jgi:hypothetical protein
MRQPHAPDDSKEKIRSKLAELGSLQATLQEREDHLLNLLYYRLWDEQKILGDQLKQLDAKKPC